jgi:hypothetical protein
LSRPRSFSSAAALCALAVGIWGTFAAIHYWRAGLTLAHYDARAHLVVARRVFDSLTPGWQQVGAVWLPLPHLLNMLPVQIDSMYRTGVSAVAISVASFTVTATTLWWWIHRATGSLAAAAAGTLVFATQPDVLYLQATPMTEPLLMATTMAGAALTWRWVVDGEADRERSGPLTHWTGAMLAAAVLTRYEAWPITFGALGLSYLVLITTGQSLQTALARVWRIAKYPCIAIGCFLILSRATVGSWLVTDGFYLVDNPDYQRPFKALGSVWWALRQLDGPVTVAIASGAAVLCLVIAVLRKAHRPLLIAGALTASALLPAYAFYNGHPFRIRYMVTLTVAVAAIGGLGIGLLPRRARAVVAALLVALTFIETPPFPSTSPMIAEAQWDKYHSRDRQRVITCLQEQFDGKPILASMGSLGHFMQETSHAGFNIRDFIHEGIGQIWSSSLDTGARHHAGWVVIEEQAEGGDTLAKLRMTSSNFLRDFTRVCEGGGVALYKRRADWMRPPATPTESR